MSFVVFAPAQLHWFVVVIAVVAFNTLIICLELSAITSNDLLPDFRWFAYFGVTSLLFFYCCFCYAFVVVDLTVTTVS